MANSGASVYGESNDSIISGAFMIRGDDHVPAFDVSSSGAHPQSNLRLNNPG